MIRTLNHRPLSTCLLSFRRLTANSSSNASNEPPNDPTGFRVLDLDKKSDERKKFVKPKPKDIPPRYLQMPIDQDWTNVWPSPHTFKYSVCPFPVRQGYVRNKLENNGIIPEKYANAELMKIPNFLHLTPSHIKKHCAAIKKFCSEFPEELKSESACQEHFPIEVMTTDYLHSSFSIRDERARIVTIRISLKSLNLDEHARDKIIRLCGARYNRTDDTITLVADRCPYRRQNYDYAMYLLTALYFESCKTEEWESLKSLKDYEDYIWDQSASKESFMNISKEIDAIKEDENSTTTADDIDNYRKCVSNLHNEAESDENLEKYKRAVEKLYRITN